MAAPANLSFEDAGAVPGMAASWHVRGRFSAVEAMAVGPTPTLTSIADPNAAGGASWTQTAITITSNSANDPDGAATADTLVETAANSAHANENAARAMTTSGRYGLACWLKDGTRGYGALVWGLGGGNQTSAIFDLVNKRVSATARSGLISKASATVFELGTTGWLLCTLYVEASAPIASIKPGIALSSNGTLLSYAGDVAKNILVWGAAVWDEPRHDVEDFERGWTNDGFLSVLTVPTSATAALFPTSGPTPEAFDGFEYWDFPFYTSLDAISAAASFDAGTPEAVEDFEEEWGATPFLTVLTVPTNATAATFDTGTPEAAEDFEEEWLSSAFITVLSGPTAALFDGPDLGEAAEDFEEVIRDKIFTVDPTTDTFTSAAHGLPNDTTVYVLQPSGGTIPAGLNPTIRYFVISTAANTFQLSLTQGGAAVDVTSAGVGTQTVRGDPARYWNETSYNDTLG